MKPATYSSGESASSLGLCLSSVYEGQFQLSLGKLPKSETNISAWKSPTDNLMFTGTPLQRRGLCVPIITQWSSQSQVHCPLSLGRKIMYVQCVWGRTLSSCGSVLPSPPSRDLISGRGHHSIFLWVIYYRTALGKAVLWVFSKVLD